MAKHQSHKRVIVSNECPKIVDCMPRDGTLYLTFEPYCLLFVLLVLLLIRSLYSAERV